MIVIREEEKLIKVDSWEAITQRDNFKSDHNPTNANLKEIIGYYDLKDMICCSLSNCHTEHMRGYLVALSDGSEINIGNQCGKKAFDIEFDTLTKDFQQFRQTEECKTVIYEAKRKLEQWEHSLTDMLKAKRGATWANTRLKSLMNRRNVTQGIIGHLNYMVKQRTGKIEVDHELTDKWEIEQIMSANPKLRYDEAKWVKKTIGHLEYLEALYPENDLQELFIKQAKTSLDAIKDCNPSQCSLSQLQELKKKANAMPDLIDKCENALSNAKQFLTRSNLDKLLPVFERRADDKKAFLCYLDNLYR
ncbi:hypothetical protein [Vibrio vulnificus]|uniref:hypothetical protein n=1 Tax=Vibrio vulnificus TaxID=672 RepID=UPI00289326E8|nr:hypothetical protein [Vibrio vulnificus]WNJ73441.1 hypothetical protein RI132_23640 [Vibrio vulnificus]HDY7474833.1 hypothetical protein [Vibrio vulnificus]HDY7818478.1 hypothetical protein [Vibrio vulnificus]